MSNRFVHAINREELTARVGRIVRCTGNIVEADGPDAYLGEICEITSLRSEVVTFAEVIGINDGRTLLFPYSDMAGISIGCEVFASGKFPTAKVGFHTLGQVLNAFGDPYDTGEQSASFLNYALTPAPLNPLSRQPIKDRLHTGVNVIDHFLTLGRGQKIGLFAGGGVGKTSLLQQIVKGTNADICIIALVGERGREVLDFVQHIDTCGTRDRTVIIAATSDQPALMRQRAAYYATSLAEFFRDQNKHVLLVMDSVTRFGMAQREIGLAIGDMPTARGYTVSTFSNLTRLVERCGSLEGKGAITGIYTILVEGDDVSEPLSDAMRATLDGHIILSRDLANARHFPAIDLLNSTSRVMSAVTNEESREYASLVIRVLAFYDKYKELINLGVYESGSNPRLDKVIQYLPNIHQFLQQKNDSTADFEKSTLDLSALYQQLSEVGL